MSQRRTADEIMHDAMAAAKLVDFTVQNGYDPLWRQIAEDTYRVVGGPRTRRLYDQFASGQRKFMPRFLDDNPEFREAFETIFGDPLRVPSYGHFRKLVKIGRDEFLTDPDLWEFLPDSFEAIYQLTLVNDDVGMLLCGGDWITKNTSLKEVIRLRHERNKEVEEYTKRVEIERNLQEIYGRRCDEVLREMFDEFVANLPPEQRAEVERRVEAKMDAFFDDPPGPHNIKNHLYRQTYWTLKWAAEHDGKDFSSPHAPPPTMGPPMDATHHLWEVRNLWFDLHPRFW